MPIRAERAEQRRAARRESIAARLLESVESLLREGRSWPDLTVEEIIARSDVPRSTFYYNFREKDELLIAISDDAMTEIVDSSAELYRIGSGSGRKAFDRQVRRTVEAWVPHVRLINALAEISAVNPRAKEQFQTGWNAAQQGVADHIRAGQADGTIRNELDPELHASWLTCMAERGIAHLVEPADEAARRALSAALADIVWTVLYR